MARLLPFVVICGAMLVAAGRSPVCLAQSATHSPEDALLAAAQKAAEQDDSSKLQALEAKALAVTGTDAKRQGNNLMLHLKSGSFKSYKDRPECQPPGPEAKCQRFLLLAHPASRGKFVLAKLYYENIEYLLVDDTTGAGTALHGFPLFSPSGSHVLVLLMNDNQAGFAVQIWRRERDKFVLDWSRSPFTGGVYTSYKLLNWSSEDVLTLQAKTDYEPPKPAAIHRFEVRHSPRGWSMVSVP